MIAASLYSCPELFVAAFAAVLLPAWQGSQGSFVAPGWLQSPSLALLRCLSNRYLDFLEKRLLWAGLRKSSSLADFASCKLVSAFVLAILSIIFYPLLTLFAAAAYMLPDLFLWVQVKKRQAEIRQALPQALDLMVMCVDAGLALDATVQRIALDGGVTGLALNEELLALGRDLLLGAEREAAYQALYQRTGVDELKTLGSALNQSAKMGLSIAKVLRAQSEFLRLRHKQNAEEKAMKLPIYMAFPMWFCIMPALLVVVVAPSIISFLHNLGRL